MKFKYVRIQFPQGGDFTTAWRGIKPSPEDQSLYTEITDWFHANLPDRAGVRHFKTENGEALRTMIEPAMALLERYGVAIEAVYTNSPGDVVAESQYWVWAIRGDMEGQRP